MPMDFNRLKQHFAHKEQVEDVGRIPQWKLSVRRFRQNKLSMLGLFILAFLYFTAFFAEFFSPYYYNELDSDYPVTPPTKLHINARGIFFYPTISVLDKENFKYLQTEDIDHPVYVKLFVKGFEFKLLGFVSLQHHFFGTVDQPEGYTKVPKVLLWGTDRQGRDMFSRMLKGGQISLSIGVISVAISTLLGSIFGTASGYFGGWVDNLMQRLIEIIQTFPTIPLWAALAAALPRELPVLQRYILISVVLAMVGWSGLARQVRGKVMGFRSSDYTAAAQVAGASDIRIIITHLVPNSISHIIVVAVLAIPGTILGETSLSFLGLGILPPAVSWGMLMRGAQSVQTILQFPWLMLPAIGVILTVLSFSFMGDGLRDALDPYG
jgi:peptide/nickel transport system permease protein